MSREKQKPQSAALKFVNQVVMTEITSRRPKVSVIVVNAPADSLHAWKQAPHSERLLVVKMVACRCCCPPIVDEQTPTAVLCVCF